MSKSTIFLLFVLGLTIILFSGVYLAVSGKTFFANLKKVNSTENQANNVLKSTLSLHPDILSSPAKSVGVISVNIDPTPKPDEEILVQLEIDYHPLISDIDPEAGTQLVSPVLLLKTINSNSRRVSFAFKGIGAKNPQAGSVAFLNIKGDEVIASASATIKLLPKTMIKRNGIIQELEIENEALIIIEPKTITNN